MREIKGPLDELIKAGQKDTSGQNDFIHATVTDEDEIFDALGQLRTVYPNILRLDFENMRTTQNNSRTSASGNVEQKSPMELFAEFYTIQNNVDLTEQQKQLMESVFEKAGGLLG